MVIIAFSQVIDLKKIMVISLGVHGEKHPALSSADDPSMDTR